MVSNYYNKFLGKPSNYFSSEGIFYIKLWLGLGKGGGNLIMWFVGKSGFGLYRFCIILNCSFSKDGYMLNKEGLNIGGLKNGVI